MYTWKLPCDRLGILSISSILPQILPQTSSQTQGNSRVSRMEHQTPSVFPGNFRKRKVLGTLCFPFCLPENLGQPKARSYFATTLRRAWGVHFAREFARHRIRRVVFVGAPRRQPGRPLATADGDWPALSAGEFAAHALRVGGAWAGGPPGRR